MPIVDRPLSSTAVILVAVALEASAAAQSRSATWEKLDAGCTARFAHSIVWAAGQDRFVLFGGEIQKDGGFDFQNDAWTFVPKERKWVKATAKGSPPAVRAYHGAAWDSKRSLMWIFGGCAGDFSGKNDLWSFDPKTGEWKEAKVAGARPGERLSPIMAYLDATDTLVVAGGLKSFKPEDGVQGDTWTLDLAKMSWTMRKDAKTPKRWQSAHAADPQGQKIVVQGGFDEAMVPRKDTWIYDSRAGNWVESEDGYGVADAHTGVYDPESHSIVVFGGAHFEGGKFSAGLEGLKSVMSFDPAKEEWTKVSTGDKGPEGRAYHAAAWCPTEKYMLVFGGTANQFSDPLREPATWILRWKK